MDVKLNKRVLEMASLLYMYIPVVVFLASWCRPLICVACIIVMMVSFVYYFELGNSKSIQKVQEKDTVCIKLPVLLIAVAFLIFIGVISGLGRWFDQVEDFEKHNAILNDLVTREWPVFYENGTEKSYLSYYLGAYMVPGFIGKIFCSVRVAEIAFFAWAEAGFVIVYGNLVRVAKAGKAWMQLLTVFLLVFMSLPLNGFGNTYEVFFGSISLIKTDCFANLFNIIYCLPQVVPIWMSVLLLADNKERVEDHGLFFIPTVFFNLISSAGLFVLYAVNAVSLAVKEKSGRKYAVKVFSSSNVSLALTTGITIVIYLLGNILQEREGATGFSLVSFSDNVPEYILYLILILLPYFLVLFGDRKKDPLFYTVFAVLALIPFFSFGYWNDLKLKFPVSMMFLLLVYVVTFFTTLSAKNGIIADIGNGTFDAKKKFGWSDIKYPVLTAVLVLMLLWGLFERFSVPRVSFMLSNHETGRMGEITAYDDDITDEEPIASLEEWATRNDDSIRSDKTTSYFVYDYETDFFYNSICRKDISGKE